MTSAGHRWIGADFSVRDVAGQPAGVIGVPPPFADELFELLSPLARGKGHIAESDLDKVLGKAGRLSYLVPAARPYTSALWGALAGSKAARSQGKKEAPPRRVAARRFASAARWLQTLLRPPGDAAHHLPLEQVIVAELPPITLEGPTVHVDASLWGGGGVLFVHGKPVEFWMTPWCSKLARHLQTEIGDPGGQTTWEYLSLLVCLLLWGARFRTEGIALLGDNISSLSGVLTLKGKNALNLITRELSWRKVRQGWRYAAGHLPTEHNGYADALSRQSAPAASEQKPFPPELRETPRARCPDLLQIWST